MLVMRDNAARLLWVEFNLSSTGLPMHWSFFCLKYSGSCSKNELFDLEMLDNVGDWNEDPDGVDVDGSLIDHRRWNGFSISPS